MVDQTIKPSADFTAIIKEMAKVLKGWGQIVEKQIKADQGAQKVAKSIDSQTKSVSKLVAEQKKLNKSYRDLVNQQKAISKATARTTEQMKRQSKEQARQIKLTSDFVQRGFSKKAIGEKRATQGEIFDYKTQVSRLKELQKQHRVSHAQIKKMWGELARGEIVAYTGAQRRVRDQLLKLRASQKALGTTARVTTRALREQGEASVAAFWKAQRGAKTTRAAVNQTKDAVKELTISWASFVRLLAVQLFHQAVSLFVRAIRDGIIATIELEKKIAEVQTISQNQPLIFEEWRKGLIAVSNAWGLPILDTVEGAYQAISNQIAEGAEAIQFMTEASRFAVTTVASTADSVNLLTAALNAFNLEVTDTNAVAASFFKTIELGRVRAAEMANTFGRIAVPAEKLGIELNQLQAAIASGTIQGLKYNEAATLIRNVLLKLIRPTDAMKNLFREWGVESGEAAIKTFGFAGVLAKIEEASHGSSTELGELFGRIRAITGAMLFAGPGLKRYQDNLVEITKATESYNVATEIVIENVGKRFEIELNKIENHFKVVGDRILRITDNVIGGFKNMTFAVKIFTNVLATLLVPGVLAATVGITKFLLKMRAAQVALAAIGGPFALILGGIAALATLGTVYQELADKIDAITTRNQEKWHRQQNDFINKERDARIQAIKDTNREQLQVLANRAAATTATIKLEERAFQKYTDFVKKVGAGVTKSISSRIRDIQNRIKELDSLISTSDYARSLRGTIDQAKIDRALSGADTGIEPTKQAKFAFVQAALLEAQQRARAAAIRGQEKEFGYWSQFINSLTQQAVAINDVMEQSQKRIGNGAQFIEEQLRRQFASREALSAFAEKEKIQEEAKLKRAKALKQSAIELLNDLADVQKQIAKADESINLEALLQGEKRGFEELIKLSKTLGVEGLTTEGLQLAQANLRLATEQRIVRLRATEERKVIAELEAAQIRKIEYEKQWLELLREAVKLAKEYASIHPSATLLPQFVGQMGELAAQNRQAGGHGIDTQLARISPNETVMNPTASRRFFSTLTAMNAGIQRFANGGAPVQYSVGDIHLHPQKASEVNVLNIGKGIRREIRRGRLRLN